MITNETDLLSYLSAADIPFTRVEHPPVYTCAEADLYRGPLSGAETKNLFLRAEARPGEERQFFLAMTVCQKRLDLKALGREIGTSKLHFGSEEQLLECLGLTPGAVTVLGLVNDPAQRVTLLVDAEYWPSEGYLCHPLVNTATLVLDHAGLLRFLELTGHAPRVVRMPPAG